MQDKIIQITVDSSPEGLVWGLSENGNLYKLEYGTWVLVLGSPEIKLTKKELNAK